VPETLHNGLVIPYPGGTWPPSNIPVEVAAAVNGPLPVPYLDVGNLPNPILVSTGVQLFVDDFLIASSSGITRTWHQGVPHPNNPTLFSDKSWEEVPVGYSLGTVRYPAKHAAVYSDGVYPHPDGVPGHLQAWYLAGGQRYLCETQSWDYGETWFKNDHNIVPGTNIVLDHNDGDPSAVYRDSASVIIDYDEADPTKRYKYIHTRTTGFYYLDIRTSSDGIHWSGVVASSEGSATVVDRTTVWYNPFRRRWIYSLRANDQLPGRRFRRYWETPGADLFEQMLNQGAPPSAAPMWLRGEWNGTTNPATQWDADNLYVSAQPELYQVDVTAYESIFVGGHAVFFANAAGDRPKLNEIYAWFSRDGFHGQRIHAYPLFGKLSSTPHAWNWGNMQPTGGPFIVHADGTKMYKFATGAKGTPGAGDARGDCQTGRWEFRRDGFASMDFGGTEGSLFSRTLQYNKNYAGRVQLQINAVVTGSMQVEITDINNVAIPGFERAKCVPITGDNVFHPVRWTGDADVSSLSGQSIRLRFYGTNADLYAFDFVVSVPRTAPPARNPRGR